MGNRLKTTETPKRIGKVPTRQAGDYNVLYSLARRATFFTSEASPLLRAKLPLSDPNLRSLRPSRESRLKGLRYCPSLSSPFISCTHSSFVPYTLVLFPCIPPRVIIPTCDFSSRFPPHVYRYSSKTPTQQRYLAPVCLHLSSPPLHTVICSKKNALVSVLPLPVQFLLFPIVITVTAEPFLTPTEHTNLTPERRQIWQERSPRPPLQKRKKSHLSHPFVWTRGSLKKRNFHIVINIFTAQPR